MRSSKLVAVAAIAIFALGACGGTGAAPTGGGIAILTPAPGTTPAPAATSGEATAAGPATSAAAVDTCALLSPDDLQTATGIDYGPGVVDVVGQCVWTDQGSDQGIVVLFVQEVPLDFIKTTFAGGEETTVAGQAAYWNPTEGLQSLWVDAGGGRTLVLSFPKSPGLGPEDLANAQKLAEIALGNL